MRFTARQGDWAILAGAAAIAVYEKMVADDEDLISCRVAAYKQSHPVLTHTVVWLTAAHLLELVDPRLDLYHWLVRWFRSASPPPQPHPQTDQD